MGRGVGGPGVVFGVDVWVGELGGPRGQRHGKAHLVFDVFESHQYDDTDKEGEVDWGEDVSGIASLVLGRPWRIFIWGLCLFGPCIPLGLWTALVSGLGGSNSGTGLYLLEPPWGRPWFLLAAPWSALCIFIWGCERISVGMERVGVSLVL